MKLRGEAMKSVEFKCIKCKTVLHEWDTFPIFGVIHIAVCSECGSEFPVNIKPYPIGEAMKNPNSLTRQELIELVSELRRINNKLLAANQDLVKLFADAYDARVLEMKKSEVEAQERELLNLDRGC
jgi:hypothetical protein